MTLQLHRIPYGLVSFIVCVGIFSLWPQLDLMVTAWFYDANQQPVFYLADGRFIAFIYWLFKDMPLVILPLLLGLSWLSLFRFAPVWCKRQARQYYFLLAFLLIGPGLIVHTGFKDNWDRARPRDVIEFGGDKVFTPPLVIADQCDKNCSFVSGHAAMGFAFLALGWVFSSWRWFAFGIGLGLFSGAIRIIMGGHFLSDIIFAGYICYFTAWLLARLILGRFELVNPRPSSVTS